MLSLKQGSLYCDRYSERLGQKEKEVGPTSPTPNGSSLTRLEELVVGERYREALHEIDMFRRKKPQRGDLLRLGVLESRCFIGLGECKEALKTARAVVEEGMQYQEHSTAVIDALLEAADASLCLFQVDTAFEMCEQADQLRQELPTDDDVLCESIRAHILHVKAIVFYYRDDVHRGIESALESLAIRERLDDTEGIVSSLIRIGRLHGEVDHDMALEYCERGLELNKQLDRKAHVINALRAKGMIEGSKRNWSRAEQLLQESLALVREYDMNGEVPPTLFSLGNLYLVMGNFHLAEEYFKESLALSEELGVGLTAALCLVCLGEIHRTRGDFEMALRAYERSMAINKEMGRTKGYLVALGNCGLVQYAMGHPDRALTLLEESLALAEKQEQAGLLGGFVRSNTILNIISILVYIGRVNEAQERLERIRQISEETGDAYDEQAHRIATALVLKSSMLPRNRERAKEYLAGILNGGFFDIELSALALLHLSELLVNELQMTGDEGVLDSLQIRFGSLQKMATDQGSTLLLVETLLLQSKVALLQLDVENAKRLLHQAQSLAEQKGLQNLSKRIINEQEVVLSELRIWEELDESKPPMAERTERVRIREQIGGIIQQGLWRKMLF